MININEKELGERENDSRELFQVILMKLNYQNGIKNVNLERLLLRY